MTTTSAAASPSALDSAIYDLKKLTRQRAAGTHQGITSICSAHPAVIEAVLVRELHSPGPVLIEATCNQVNQFGGYTGMTPADFRAYTLGIAAKVGFPDGRILFGGDHLGPNPWKSLPAEQALKNSEDLVAAFVDAGFTKIHIDTSMACAGDPTPLPDAVIAERAARLAKVAESRPNSAHLRYVIGTEVPTPGGALEHHTTLAVTSPADAERALALHRDAFARLGLEQVWDKVIALVVQPGVEFGDESIDDYAPEKARELSKLLDRHPGIVFEAHSTDYQRPRAFYELVRDGFPILKVGPAMTYAYRLAVFALESIEREIVPEAEWSRLAETAERVMLAHPENWQHHYHGSEATLRRLRVHSYSDRIRYYWNQPELEQAVAKLYENLGTAPLPETLVATYLPLQYARWREGKTAITAHALVLDSIHGMLEPYLEACAAR